MMNPAIVVAAYNRAQSLERLLQSLARAVFDQQVELVISIDKSDNPAVAQLARKFPWPHGTKHVRLLTHHLGLKEHLLRCGDLAAEYGSIVLLEDDLFVSPYFYRFSCEALAYYSADPTIAGIALYSHRYNETTGLAFRPLEDDGDVFSAQVPCSWGQCWSDKQWQSFRRWYEINQQEGDEPDLHVPANVRRWPATSWKKHFFRYMISTNKYFVYPRISLSTNFSDLGVHHNSKTAFLQTPLLVRPKTFEFTRQARALAVYDAFLEILPNKLVQLAPHLGGQSFVVDLYGRKPLEIIQSPRILTARKCRQPETTFGRELKPVELNVCYQIKGNAISLGPTVHCRAAMERPVARDVVYFHDVPPRLLRGSRLVHSARVKAQHCHLLLRNILQQLPTHPGRDTA